MSKGMTGRIYVGYNKHWYMLNIQVVALAVLGKNIFPILSLWQKFKIWIPGAGIKGTTKHCYIQNINALGFVDLEKNFVYCFFPL